MKLNKLLLTLGLFAFGLVSFCNADQFFAYNKQMPKNTNIPDYIVSGTTFYTDLVDIDKSNFNGSVRFLIQSNYNCSPGTIYVKDNSLNSRSYLRYSMSYISNGAICVSPEINLDQLSSLKFFYGTTQNTSSANYVQFVIVDSDSFNLSVKPLSTSFSASVSKLTACPECPVCPVCPNIDSEYCINNNLCPVVPYFDKLYCMSEYGLIEPESCPSAGDCPTEGFSRLSINGVDQNESLLYNVNIPDFIKYDYINYSNQVSDLNVEGYNEDLEYIQGIVDIQEYTPTSEDFTTVFLNLIPYMKIIIFVLFLFLIWKWIKKLF